MKHALTALLCLKMAGGVYTQIAQPITGVPLCTTNRGVCAFCQGTRTEAGTPVQPPRHHRRHR
jgi:hypothetical protein